MIRAISDLWQKALFAASGRLPCRIIADRGQPYLERYYLCTVLGTRFYIHRFVGDDPDRGLHDHPWPWAVAIVLAGWYWEVRRSGTRQVRWVNQLNEDTFHRVLLPKDSLMRPQPCWTLFCHRATNTKAWGFWTPAPIAGTIHDGTVPIPGAETSAHQWTPHDQVIVSVGSDWWLRAPAGRDTPNRVPAN